MSVKIKKNTITHTRGDTLRAKVDLWLDAEQTEPYIPEAEDVIRFALKHPALKQKEDDPGYEEYVDQTPIFTVVIPSDTQILHIKPNQTKNLGFGEYEYDIEITHADGTVDTFITAAPYNLTKEVH